MRVLFLGGPWHNERHEVMPSRAASIGSLPVQFSVPVVLEESEVGGRPRVPHQRGKVVYTRRFARAGGERLPVYVSPDYDGPARA
jgi:hypothetical protein